MKIHVIVILLVLLSAALSCWADPSTAHDGIPDSWKTNGVDVTIEGSKQHMTLPGASVRHKDIYVWVAWMEDANHSHRPTDDALKGIQEAFAKAPTANPDGTTGIVLHYVFAQKPVSEQTILGTTNPITEEYDWTEFDKIKDQVFPAELKGVFFFCLFAHLMDEEHHTGIAKTIPGRDFIVSLGGTRTEVGTTQEQAGTFMHELGHALGLRHGGVDDQLYKPNYLSVMNYAFQLDGILVNGTPGHLDYSRFSIDARETALSEALGLSSDQALAKYGTYFFCEHDSSLAKSAESIVGPIDWTCRGVFEQNVSTDINGDGNRTLLAGFNDWQQIRLAPGAPSAGVAPRIILKPKFELTPERSDAFPVMPVMGVTAKRGDRSVKLAWQPIPLDRVVAYRVFRSRSATEAPVEVGSTADPTFLDQNLNTGQYAYTVSVAFLPHSRAQNDKLLGRTLAEFSQSIEKSAELYKKGSKSATHGLPIIDKFKIKEMQAIQAEKSGTPSSEAPGLLLQSAPSKAAIVAIQ